MGKSCRSRVPTRHGVWLSLAALVIGALLLGGVSVGAEPGRDSAPDCFGRAVTNTDWTDGADLIEGTVGNDVLYGGGGNDTIDGKGGNDRICGGAGKDVLIGGAGNDRVNGGAGKDTIKFTDSPTGVTVNLSDGSASGHGSDIIKKVERITGSNRNDTLIGNGGRNRLDGRKGNDNLTGNAGNDYLNGGPGTDTLDGGSGTDKCLRGETLTSCELPLPPAPVTFGNGTHRIGTDIPAGRYRMISDGTSCYWERLSGFGGTFGEIITNDFGYDTQIVDIEPTDRGFASSNCNTWSSDLTPRRPKPGADWRSDGHLLVGTEMKPGTWRNSQMAGSCYWERLSGFSGFGNIIANDFTYDPSIVTIMSSDVGFYAKPDCGVWERTS